MTLFSYSVPRICLSIYRPLAEAQVVHSVSAFKLRVMLSRLGLFADLYQKLKVSVPLDPSLECAAFSGKVAAARELLAAQFNVHFTERRLIINAIAGAAAFGHVEFVMYMMHIAKDDAEVRRPGSLTALQSQGCFLSWDKNVACALHYYFIPEHSIKAPMTYSTACKPVQLVTGVARSMHAKIQTINCSSGPGIYQSNLIQFSFKHSFAGPGVRLRGVGGSGPPAGGAGAGAAAA